MGTRKGPLIETQADAARKRAQVMSLRLGGATFIQIAEQVGYRDAPEAYVAYKRGMDETIQPIADEIRYEELRRLDRLILTWWPKALGAANTDPSPKAADIVFRCMEKRAKLLGLDAPIKQEVELSYDDGDEVSAKVAELLRMVRTEPTST